MNRRTLKFIGHEMRSESLEKNVLTGMVVGNRGRDKPKTRLSGNIKDICGLTTLYKLKERRKIEYHGEGWWRGARLGCLSKHLIIE